MRFPCAAFLFLLFFSLPALAQLTKVDPLVQKFAREKIPPQAGLGKGITANSNGELFVEAFVRVYGDHRLETVAGRIRDIGGAPRSLIGDILTATLPLNAIGEIAEWEEVRYIEAAKPLLPKVNSSIVTLNVDDVHAGTGLDARYDGSGAIIGIVDDTRPDWGHNDFTDSDGDTRVLFLWDKANTGSGVSEISSSTGLECSKAKIDAGTCSATAGGDSTSHASHVAGIAAGDDSTYKGMAPGADLIFVYNVETDADSGGNLSTTIVDDVEYIFAKAKSLKQPAVVNLSLGTSIGAHDDTSSMETALNNLVKGHPGRAIVNAAGNENFNTNDTGAATYSGLHASIDVASSTDEAFEFKVRNGSTIVSLGREVILDIWLTASSSCTVELDAINAAKDAALINMSAVSKGSSGTKADSEITTLTVSFTDSANANNGKQHIVATVNFGSGVSTTEMQDTYSFDLIFRGTCSGDAWIWPDRNAAVSFTKNRLSTAIFGYTYQAGDSARTITIPGSASKIIAVGSFMHVGTWTDSTGSSHSQTATSGTDFTSLGATGGTVGGISLFSSLGPTPDGRKKPDITAPGEPILSSLSANASPSSGRKVNSKHVKLEGTSMSAPHVAGIVALMFQKNPCLTSDEVKTLLTSNAATDSSTGTSLPDNTWGYGKADALATMKDVTTNKSCSVTSGDGNGSDSTPVTTTSGASAGGGCFAIAGTPLKKGGLVLCGLFSLLLLVSRLDAKRGGS